MYTNFTNWTIWDAFYVVFHKFMKVVNLLFLHPLIIIIYKFLFRRIYFAFARETIFLFLEAVKWCREQIVLFNATLYELFLVVPVSLEVKFFLW